MTGALLQSKNKITSIPIADKPPRLGGIIREVNQSEFQQLFNLPYAEEIWLDEALPKTELDPAIQNAASVTAALFNQIQEVINHPFKALCLAKINNHVGYGVFAKNPIKKDALICIYSGEIGSNLDPNLKGMEHGYVNTTFCFKQTKARGVASFIQHLPTAPKFSIEELRMMGQNLDDEVLLKISELYFIEFNSIISKNNLSTVNIEKKYLVHQGIPIIAFFANRDITEGEQLGINYGLHYWRCIKICPELFQTSGDVMPREQYQRTYGDLYFADVTYTGHLRDLCNLIKVQHSIELTTTDGSRVFPNDTVLKALSLAGAIPPEIKPPATCLTLWSTQVACKENQFRTHHPLKARL